MFRFIRRRLFSCAYVIYALVVCLIWLNRWLLRTIYSNPVAAKPEQTDGLVVGYTRESMRRVAENKEDEDATSTERQRRNILDAAKRFQLGKVKIFEEPKGHRSGASIKNRPMWRKLDARIRAGKVRVLIVNDLSRLHRKGWRIGELLDWLEKHNVRLILAAPGREVDVSSIMGKMFVAFVSLIDEYYVADVSLRAKDSIQRRRLDGKTVSTPPFGTHREHGFLRPSPHGAWLLANGRYVPGRKGDEPPERGAIWRGYYECARRILKLYSRNTMGSYRIAYELSSQGWVFGMPGGQPRLLTRDDVRRVVASWPAYSGLVWIGHSKDRKVNVIPLDWPETGRHVFPVRLLRKVAEVEHQRRLEPRAMGMTREAHAYPLARLAYCAQCVRNAEAQQNPQLRRRLTGSNQRDVLRYVHAEGINCGSHKRSVQTDIIEDKVHTILKSLRFRAEAVGIMWDLGQRIDRVVLERTEDLEARRRISIKRREQGLNVLRKRLEEGEGDPEDLDRKIEAKEKQLRALKRQRIDPKGTSLQFGRCIDGLVNLGDLWQTGEAHERQLIARLVFNHLVFDLDTGEIVSYQLRPWIEELVERR